MSVTVLPGSPFHAKYSTNRGWFSNVIEVGGTAPAIVTDQSESTYLRMTGQGNTVPEAWFQVAATALPANPSRRYWQFIVRQYDANVLTHPVFSPYVLAPVPYDTGGTVWAYIVQINQYPPTVTPTYLARLQVNSIGDLGLSSAFQSFELDAELEPGASWAQVDTAISEGSAWIAMFHDYGGFDDDSSPQELTLDWADLRLIYEADLPLRNIQRDDLRGAQTTSRRLSTRNAAYI
jgi:hypothetical protein